MNAKEFNKKDDRELTRMLREFRTKLGEVRFHVAADQHKHVREIRVLRGDIARIMTILNERKHSAVTKTTTT